MPLARTCKKPSGRISAEPGVANVSRLIRVVAHSEWGVQAVIIPDGLSPLHRMIAMSIGSEANRCSGHLTDLWKLGEVWGTDQWINDMEMLVNPPRPRSTQVVLA